MLFGDLNPDDRGPAVTELQRNLSVLGYPLAITGVYDDTTYVAIRQFQGDQGLPVTGLVDASTQSRIMSELTAQAPTVPLPSSSGVAKASSGFPIIGAIAIGVVWWIFFRRK